MNERKHQHEERHSGIASSANIGGHPIHPMLIPFPIAFLTGALLTDAAYWLTGEMFWARASLWLIGAGVVAGLLAAGVGAIDYFTIERVRSHGAGNIHAILNVIVVVLASINLFMRWNDPASVILWWGFILSLVTAGLLAVSG